VHRAPGPTFAVRLATWRTAKGAVHCAPGPIVAVRHVARQRAGSTLRLDHSLPCALPRGARQRVLPFPCVLSGARQRGCDAISPRPAVNTFSLSCVTYYARQRTVPCVAFSQSARQSSLPGKNESGALCRALWENAHGKGGAVRFRPTAKSAIPVVWREWRKR
jgi:hypothetical protein